MISEVGKNKDVQSVKAKGHTLEITSRPNCDRQKFFEWLGSLPCKQKSYKEGKKGIVATIVHNMTEEQKNNRW